MMVARQLFHGTAALARFVWRTDRLKIILWHIALTALTIAIAASFSSLYPTQLERQLLAETMRNPAMTAMLGPGYGLDQYTPGAMMAHQMLLFTAVLAGVMNVLLVVRSTRADEQAGRLEMIRSLPVGRLSPPAATMIVMTASNVALALIVAVCLGVSGIESIDWAGSFLYGAVLGATGVLFAAVTLLCAQWAPTSRGALGYGFALLGGAYLLRAIGDTSAEWLSLVSPLGLILRTKVYVDNIWWPVFIVIGISAIIASAAFLLNAVRDLGAGLIPDRPGPEHASRWLLNPLGIGGNSAMSAARSAKWAPLGLALRLQRTVLIGWAVAMFTLGVSYGSVFGELEAFFDSTEIIRQLLPEQSGVSMTEQFAAMVTTVMAMLGAVPAMLTVFKLKREEDIGRTEPLLAGAVSRTQVMGSYIILALLAAVVMPIAANFGLATAAMPVMEDPLPMNTFVGAGLAYVPAIMAMVGLAAVTVGFAPRLAVIPWIYLIISFFIVYLGPLLQLPEWLGRLSPFGHIPQLPVESFRMIPIAVVGALAVALLITSVVGYRRRDVFG